MTMTVAQEVSIGGRQKCKLGKHLQAEEAQTKLVQHVQHTAVMFHCLHLMLCVLPAFRLAICRFTLGR